MAEENEVDIMGQGFGQAKLTDEGYEMNFMNWKGIMLLIYHQYLYSEPIPSTPQNDTTMIIGKKEKISRVKLENIVVRLKEKIKRLEQFVEKVI